jgi:hypothetical protein
MKRMFQAALLSLFWAAIPIARETIRRILARIAKPGKGAALDAAFAKLLILAGKRKLGEAVERRPEICQFSTTSWITTLSALPFAKV